MNPLRLIRLCLAGCLLCALSARADGVEWVRLWSGYRTAADFIGLREYFTGRESAASRAALRTQPGSREGYYFNFRLRNPGPALPQATLEIQVIKPTDPKTEVYTLPLPIPEGSTLFKAGITGQDWPLKDKAPVAWKLTVKGPDGSTLGERQSFLWALDK
jgi:hypothetical protein